MKKEVREGYKMTELGEIPKEWNIKRIGDITEIKTGGTPATKCEEYWKNGTIPWMASGDINKKIINKVNGKITNIGMMNSAAKLLPKDTVMIALNGQGKTKGTVGYLNIELTCNQSLAGFLPNYKEFNSKYLYYNLQNRYFELRELAGDGARNGLNLGLLRNIKIPLPFLSEQEKIASILSMVDEQIENTEKLIRKNKELKKGLMQQLLTKGIGHTEFKKTEIGDIPKEWEVKRFKDISKVSQGLQIAIEERFKEFKQGRLPYITIQYINDKSNSDNEYFIENYNENVVCYESDILMTRTGNTGIVITNEYGVFHNNFFKVDFDRTKLNKDFLVYYLNTPFIQNLIIRYAGTTTIPDLKHSDFYKLPVLVPKIEEQKKIALILSSIDENIIEYKDKKEKLKILKRGLMQKLLSGEIRILNFNEN